MPTYAYRCPSCGHEFDEFQKMSDPPRARCPACDAWGERVITGGGGFLLKGGGFYATDYRSESYKKAAKSESPGGEAAAGAEAKPEKAVSGDPGGAGKAKDSGASTKAGGDAAPAEGKAEKKRVKED